jgi:hypothetical protein
MGGAISTYFGSDSGGAQDGGRKRVIRSLSANTAAACCSRFIEPGTAVVAGMSSVCDIHGWRSRSTRRGLLIFMTIRFLDISVFGHIERANETIQAYHLRESDGGLIFHDHAGLRTEEGDAFGMGSLDQHSLAAGLIKVGTTPALVCHMFGQNPTTTSKKPLAGVQILASLDSSWTPASLQPRGYNHGT